MFSLILKTMLLGLLLGSGPALAAESAASNHNFQLAQSDSSFGGLDNLPLVGEADADSAETDADDNDARGGWSPAFWSALAGVAVLVAGVAWYDRYAWNHAQSRDGEA